MQASGTPLNDKLESYMKRRNEIVQEFRTLDRNDSIRMEKAKVPRRNTTGSLRKPMPRMQETPWVSSGFFRMPMRWTSPV